MDENHAVNRSWLVAIVVVLIVALVPIRAHAQSQEQALVQAAAPLPAADAPAPAPQAPAAAADQLGEIIVTTRRIEESMQEVPQSTVAITGAALQQVTTSSDLTSLVPGLQVINQGPLASISIRGQGNRLSTTPILTTTIYQDGFALPAFYTEDAFSIDPARIEVAKGPQSTLFGRATLTGAVNIVTADPTSTPQGFVEAGGGTSSVAHEAITNAKAMISGPLIGDKVEARLVFGEQSDNGYIYDPVTGIHAPLYNRLFIGLKWLFHPIDNLTIRLNTTELNNKTSRATLAASWDPSFAPPLGLANVPPGADPISDPLSKVGNGYQTELDNESAIWVNTNVETLDIRYQTPIGELVSLTGASKNTYNDHEGGGSRLNIGSDCTIPGATVSYPGCAMGSLYGGSEATTPLTSQQHHVQDDRTISQEFRLDGSTARFQYLVGMYYLWDNILSQNPQAGIGGSPFDSVLLYAYGPGTTNYDVPNYYSPNPAKAQIGQFAPFRNTLINNAAYAQLGYDLTKKLNLTAGVRWSRDDLTGIYGIGNEFANGTQTTFVPMVFRSADADAVTGEAILSYHFTPAVMGYASYSRGNAPGGFNGATTTASAVIPFGPESVNDYELGFKSTFFDRYRLNVALFDSVYTNLQVSEFETVFVGGSQVSLSLTTNAAKSYARGLDVELAAVLSDHWTLSGGFTLLNAEYTDYYASGINKTTPLINFSGTSIIGSPQDSGNMTLDFHYPWGPGTLDLSATEVWSSWNASVAGVGDPAGTAYPGYSGATGQVIVPSGVTTKPVIYLAPTPGYGVTNFTANYTTGPWMFTFRAQNLFNRFYILAANSGGGSPEALPTFEPGVPRTVTANVHYKFFD